MQLYPIRFIIAIAIGLRACSLFAQSTLQCPQSPCDESIIPSFSIGPHGEMVTTLDPQPGYVFRFFISHDLVSWDDLGVIMEDSDKKAVSRNYRARQPKFYYFEKLPSFAPFEFYPEFEDESSEVLGPNVTLTPGEPANTNYLFRYFEDDVQEGVRITMFGRVRYARVDRNTGHIHFEFQSVEIMELPNGDILRFSVPELARLGNERLAELLDAFYYYDSPNSGEVEFQTRYTDGFTETAPIESFDH